jgi:hypothetical protein
MLTDQSDCSAYLCAERGLAKVRGGGMYSFESCFKSWPLEDFVI